MNIWPYGVITSKGIALQTKLIAGTTLTITRAVVGAGFVPPPLLKDQTAVSDPRQTLALQTISYPEEGKCALPMILDNTGLAEGYTAHQLGIFANDPDEGEILYCILGTATGGDKDGTVVPSEAEMAGYGAEWTIYFRYGQADGVVVTVDSSVWVSKETMQKYIASEIKAITLAEIDDAWGSEGGSIGGGGSGEGGTGIYTLDHSQLYNRDAYDQHPIESITGLEEALEAAEGSEIDSNIIEIAWESATNDNE